MRDAGEEPADRRHFTNQGSDGKRAPAPPAGRRRPVHRHRGKGETPGRGKGNCARSEGSPHPPARGGRAAPQGDPREDGAGHSGRGRWGQHGPVEGASGCSGDARSGGKGKAENRKSGGRSPGGTGAPMVSAAGRQRRERRREETVPRPRGALGRPGPPARPWETSGRGDLGTEGGRVTQRPRGAETVGRAARLQSRFFAQTNKY